MPSHARKLSCSVTRILISGTRCIFVAEQEKLQASTVPYRELGCNIFPSHLHVHISDQPAPCTETRTQIIKPPKE
jgi:hypothetical protein